MAVKYLQAAKSIDCRYIFTSRKINCCRTIFTCSKVNVWPLNNDTQQNQLMAVIHSHAETSIGSFSKVTCNIIGY
jgi:hypothetical protein